MTRKTASIRRRFGLEKGRKVVSEPSRYDQIVATLRALCLRLPQAYEERAWTGTRWLVRKQTFAHVLEIRDGWPPAYAKAARLDGPAVVMTFRSPLVELNVHAFTKAPFFRPVWFPDIVGMVLDGNTDWDEVQALVTDSYRMKAPKKLAVQVLKPKRDLAS